MNPFTSDTPAFCFSDAIQSQVENMQIGESKILNMYGKNTFAARPLIKYVSEKIGFKLQTRTDENGGLWVRRIK